MADEKAHGPNWLLGVDKLTTPTFDFLGVKLRDKLRTWMAKTARERATIRRFEKEFLYRHMDLRGYGAVMYEGMLENMVPILLERQFEVIKPLIIFAVTEHQIPPERAFEVLLQGVDSGPQATNLTGGELILSSAAASVLNSLIAVHTATLMFRYTHLPLAVHIEYPDMTDEEFEILMQDPATLQGISSAMDPGTDQATKLFAKTLTEAYGHPFDEAAFDKLCDNPPPEKPGE
jgi:hypothetical protein